MARPQDANYLHPWEKWKDLKIQLGAWCVLNDGNSWSVLVSPSPFRRNGLVVGNCQLNMLC